MKRVSCSPTTPQSKQTSKSMKIGDIYTSPSSHQVQPTENHISIENHINTEPNLTHTLINDEQLVYYNPLDVGVQCEMGTECLRFCQPMDNENFPDIITPEITLDEIDQTIPSINDKPIFFETQKIHSSNTRSWQFFETLIFLRTCIEHDIPAKMQEKNYKFSEIFHNVMIELQQQYGFERSTTQLKDKYKRLKSLYNRGEVAGIETEILECLATLFGYPNGDNQTKIDK